MSDIFTKLEAFLQEAAKPLVVVLGPTASGKTGFSIALARAMENEWKMENGKWKMAEVLNADSRQLYRFMDIGTAKITPEEMGGIPHHLLSMKDPDEEVTAAWYKEAAEKTIDEILGRGNVPMLVGGSMLYISAIIDNLSFADAADPAKRAEFSALYDRDGGATLYGLLQKLDPEGAEGIDPRNKVYLIRAMEIVQTAQRSLLQSKGSALCPYDLFIIGMDLPAEDLAQRITDRVKQMFALGWLDEVRALLKRGFSPEDPGMISHGYREIVQYLRSADQSDGALRILQGEIAAKSRQYAKRQRTWWRHDARIHRVTPGEDLYR